jgi:hypothetical protein
MKPLSKKTRFKLIILSLLVFAFLVPAVLAASFGYKINSVGDLFTFVKTGGVYLHSDISNTSIYLEDEYIKDNGRLIRNTLIQELVPNKEYEVVIIKEGLHDWRKTLMVYPSLVTEASVLMLPTELDNREVYPFTDKEGNGTTTPPTTISINLANGKIIPTNAEYVALMDLFHDTDFYGLQEEVDTVDTKEIVSVDIASTTPEEVVEIEDHFVALGVENPEDLDNLRETKDQVAWIEGGDVLLHWIDEGNTPNYYYCLDLDNCRNKITLDWEDEILAFEFMPDRNEILIVLTNKGVYAVEVDDRSERNIQPIRLGESLELGRTSSNKIVVKEREVFYEFDL